MGMTNRLLEIIAASSLVLIASVANAMPCDEVASCGNHGTSVVFEASPAEAARKAIEEEKLVFVLHVSGNFETPKYT